MSWWWPLKGVRNPLPGPAEPGRFGAPRKRYIHPGVDCYAPAGTIVRAVESGVVEDIIRFTGPKATIPSSWWNDTLAVVVRGQSGRVLYGELDTRLCRGDRVDVGGSVGWILTVLKKLSANPPANHQASMLHLELYSPDAPEVAVTWEPGQPCPEGLWDPTSHLASAL